MHKLIKLSFIGVGLLLVIALLSGCSETACERARVAGEPTHACYVERHREEPEVLKEEEREETADEIDEEVEEVEDVLKEEKAHETAQAIRELGE